MKRRLSPAMLVALVALFCATAGSGYAANTLSTASTVTVRKETTIKPGQTKTVALACPLGSTVVTGGYKARSSDTYFNGTPVVLSSYPTADGWTVTIENPDEAGYASQRDNWDHYATYATCSG